MEDLLGMLIFAFVLIVVFARNAAKAPPPKKNASRPFSVDDMEVMPHPVATQPAAAPAQPSMLPPRPAYPLHPAEGESQPPTFAERMRSMEGRDPCHEEQLAPAVRPAAAQPILTEAEAQPAITLDFTKDELLRAVVMQEVLTRPCERRNRRIG